MSVRQQYYTSYRNTVTGSTGFQIKATSADISPNLQGTIARLIGYSVPQMLDIRAIDTHPIALRYWIETSHYRQSQATTPSASKNKPRFSWLGRNQKVETSSVAETSRSPYGRKNECILLCSQSIGNDDSDRPGNFFAHTLVLEPDSFTAIPPIFYWKSPFWQKQDPVERTQLDSLSILPAFDDEPSLKLDKVWSFIDGGGRRDLLYKLLCAVVYSHKTYRRIVILDATENTAYWIAAISCLLPPMYRPLLTFATYHHEPQQGHFLITGMTSASAFNPSATDHRTFFILDGYAGTTSDVQDSSYAQLAATNARPDLYEAHLLSRFVDLAPQPSADLVIDEQLNALAP